MTEINKKLSNIQKEIIILGQQANNLLNTAKADINNKRYFKEAASIFLKIIKTYEQYNPFIILFPEHNSILLQANLHHDKYLYALCLGRYKEFNHCFTDALTLYKEAEEKCTIAVRLIEHIKNNHISTNPKENSAILEDYHHWMIDHLEIKGLVTYLESCIDWDNKNFCSAYDKSYQVLDYCEQIRSYTNTYKDYFSPEEFRIREATLSAMAANLYSISAESSIVNYFEVSSLELLQDILFYLLSSYSLTDKAIQTNNFWSHYKVIRNQISDQIVYFLTNNKKHWTILLENEEKLPNLIYFMKKTDYKYHKKITKRRATFIMNIFKNKVKTKGNVIINNGGTNHNAQNNSFVSLLSTDDKQSFGRFIEYIKQNKPNDVSYDEHIHIISSLLDIANSTTSAEESTSMQQWRKKFLSFSSSAIKFLSTSADILSVSDFIRKLLNI